MTYTKYNEIMQCCCMMITDKGGICFKCTKTWQLKISPSCGGISYFLALSGNALAAAVA